MPAFDVAAIRAQFPALRRQQDGRPVVFLDGPGGTQVPDRVIDAVAGYYRTMNANSGGSFVTSRASGSMANPPTRRSPPSSAPATRARSSSATT